MDIFCVTHSLTHRLTDSQTHSLTHRKVFLQSCIAAAKKWIEKFRQFKKNNDLKNCSVNNLCCFNWLETFWKCQINHLYGLNLLILILCILRRKPWGHFSNFEKFNIKYFNIGQKCPFPFHRKYKIKNLDFGYFYHFCITNFGSNFRMFWSIV